MKRFSLMAAISALLGSSVSEASPAFKKYKDALAAYKKDASEAKADAVIAAYEALGGPRALKGDILARDQYAVIAVGKDASEQLRARRKLLKAAKRGGAGVADKQLKALIDQLQADLAATKSAEAGLNRDKAALEADIEALRREIATKAIDHVAAVAKIAELEGEVLRLKFQINRAAVEAEVKANLLAALGKADLHDKIAGVADVISKLGDIKELLAIAVGPDGIEKLKIAAILDKEAQSAQPLKDLAAALHAKATATGADYTTLVDAIKARAEAIEKAGSAIDWGKVGTDLPLGKLGKVVRIKDAINLIKNAQDLADYTTPVILAIGSAIGAETTFIDDATIATLSDQEKKDFESFYLDYLAFVKRAIAFADSKSIDQNSPGYALLIAAQNGINTILPDLITGGAADGGAAATKLPLTKLDVAEVDEVSPAALKGAALLAKVGQVSIDAQNELDGDKAKEYLAYLKKAIANSGIPPANKPQIQVAIEYLESF